MNSYTQRIIVAVCMFCTIAGTSAQGIKYETVREFPNGLAKVYSNGYYGLKDTATDRLIVGLEYDDFDFYDGLAMLRNPGDGRVMAVVDYMGNVARVPANYYTSYTRYYEGYLPVSTTPVNKALPTWGYIDRQGYALNLMDNDGKPDTRNSLKALSAGPFSEGYAVVTMPKGWQKSKSGIVHIDQNGYQRFRLPGNVEMRSSVLNGECVMLVDGRLAVYQESTDGNFDALRVGLLADDVKMKKGVLTDKYKNLYEMDLDEYGHALRVICTTVNDNVSQTIYENTPKPAEPEIVEVTVEEPEPELPATPTFDPENDLNVQLARQVVSATAKGRAVLELKVTNRGESASGPMKVTIDCGGAKKEGELDLGSGATGSVSISVPAKFSVSEVSRTLKWTITTDDWQREGSANVKIKRYKPQR